MSGFLKIWDLGFIGSWVWEMAIWFCQCMGSGILGSLGFRMVEYCIGPGDYTCVCFWISETGMWGFGCVVLITMLV